MFFKKFRERMRIGKQATKQLNLLTGILFELNDDMQKHGGPSLPVVSDRDLVVLTARRMEAEKVGSWKKFDSVFTKILLERAKQVGFLRTMPKSTKIWHVTPCLNDEKVYKVLKQGGPEALRKRMIEDWPALEWARTDPRRNVFEVQTESSG